jgi:hypothetical protein
VIRGTIQALDGTAIGGASLSVSGLPGGVMTDVKGRFSVKLPRGVSREVRFSYAAGRSAVVKVLVRP